MQDEQESVSYVNIPMTGINPKTFTGEFFKDLLQDL